MKLKCFLSILIVVVLLIGCAKSLDEKSNENPVIPETVTANLNFKVFADNSSTSNSSSPLPGVSILVVGTDGSVIDKLISNEQGEAQKDITVSVDHKYLYNNSNTILPRGTITAIAFKEGYRQTVLFEVPVSEEGSVQSFLMNPVISGERNKPDAQLGNNHRLNIISLVKKYQEILNNNY